MEAVQDLGRFFVSLIFSHVRFGSEADILRGVHIP
jgi:hypothetical protein